MPEEPYLTRRCGNKESHPSHTRTVKFDGAPVQDPRFHTAVCPGVLKLSGLPFGGSDHKHDWDRSDGPLLMRPDSIGKKVEIGRTGVPWQGRYDCTCGQARWLTNGRLATAGDRFPRADVMHRITFLREKLDRGGMDAFSDDDKAEINLIADSLGKAFQPITEAFTQLAQQTATYLVSFWGSLPEEVREGLAEIAGRDIDSENVDLLTGDGHVVAHYRLSAWRSPSASPEGVQAFMDIFKASPERVLGRANGMGPLR